VQFLLFWWRCRSCGFFWPRFLTASSIFARGPRMSHHPSHVVEDSEKWTCGLWAVQKAVVIFFKVMHNVDKFMLKLHFKFYSIATSNRIWLHCVSCGHYIIKGLINFNIRVCSKFELQVELQNQVINGQSQIMFLVLNT
jgi:hypothetical protein